MWLPRYAHPRRICQLQLLLQMYRSLPLMERCLGAIIGLCRILTLYYKRDASGFLIFCIGSNLSNIYQIRLGVCQHFSY